MAIFILHCENFPANIFQITDSARLRPIRLIADLYLASILSDSRLRQDLEGVLELLFRMLSLMLHSCADISATTTGKSDVVNILGTIFDLATAQSGFVGVEVRAEFHFC